MFVKAAGKRIHYIDEGQGDPILFVHGWGGTSASLLPLARSFIPEHRIIIPDLPGFGQSDNPDSSWGPTEYARCIEEFLTALSVREIVFVGHSFGGGIGIIMASSAAHPVTKLILAGAAYRRTGSLRNSPSTVGRLLAATPWLLPARNILYRIFFRSSDLLKYPALESNFKRIVSTDLTPQAGKVSVPTLILWGEKDTQTPVADARRLVNLIHGSVLRTYPDIRHNLPIIRPDEVARDIKKFL